MLTDITPTWAEVQIGAQIDVTFQWEMTPGCLYEITAGSAIEDDVGNAMDPDHAMTKFTGFQPIHPQGRRFDYWTMCVPEDDRRADETLDLKRVANCIQEILDLMLISIDKFVDQFDPDLCTDAQIDLMLYDMGNPFDWAELELTPTQRRKLLRMLVDIYKSKGTDWGTEQAVLFLLGEVVEVVAFMDDCWVLGVDELGEGSIAEILCDNAEPYDFSGAPLTLDVELESVAQTVTFLAGDFADPGNGTADEVAARIAADLDGGGSYAAAVGTPAVLDSGNMEPFAVSAGDDLHVKVNGASFSIVFHADDFAAPGAATADEIALRIIADVVSLRSSDESGAVRMKTHHTGADASIQVTGGSANAALGFSAVEINGTDAQRVAAYSESLGPDAEIHVTGGTAKPVLGFDDDPVAGTGGVILGADDRRALYSFDIETENALSSEA